MEIWVLPVATVLIALAIRLAIRDDRKEVWQALARDLDTTYARSRFGPHVVEGRLHGQRVRVEEVHSGGRNSSTQIEVRVDSHLDPELVLSNGGQWAELKQLFGGRDLKVGDTEFDRRVEVKGPEVNALAALNEPARRAIEALEAAVAKGVTFNGGALKFKLSGHLVENRAFWGGVERAQVRQLIQQAVHAGELLSVPHRDLRAALARNALQDSVPEVRIRNLQALAAHYPHGALARKAGQRAIQEDDPHLRLLGARLLGGDQGAAELATLAKGLGFTPALRVAALAELARTSRFTQLWQAAREMLSAEDASFQRDVLGVLGALRAQAPADPERALLGDRIAVLALDPPLADACALALAAVGDSLSQPVLLRLLGAGETAVKIAAANALARVGTIEAVAPLVEQARPVLMNGDLKEALREAVRRIQGRLGDAEEGRLSLATQPEAAGGLSLAEPEEEQPPVDPSEERAR
jgi:hypothetical protein